MKIEQIWMPSTRWPGYEASDYGRVRSVKRGVRRVLAMRVGPQGYPVVTIRRVSVPVHKVVADAFLGPRPPGMQTRHLDGDKTNNDLSNLEYGTPRENTADAIEHGTHVSLRHRAKTHCVHGHKFTPRNTYIHQGRRRCRICRSAACERYRERRTAAS